MKEDNEKPKFDEYKRWLIEERNINITGIASEYYESVRGKILKDFKNSSFWDQFTGNYTNYANEYRDNTGGYDLWKALFTKKQLRNRLLPKTFNSFFLKTYRKNISENKCWPESPKNGWLFPDNWFFKISDIVRTRFTVKYFDGVNLVVNKIIKLCEQQDLKYECSFEAKEEGYYAAHLHVIRKYKVPGCDWGTEIIETSVEIQITTQLQEIIQKMLHLYYEEKREKTNEIDIKWQWDYKNSEFNLNYLAHMLHYIEGKIVEIRNSKKEDIVWK